VIALDDRLRHGLSSGNAEAINAWKSIAQAADFFEKKKDWRTLKAHANLGVISRFAGDSAFLGPEILNLGARDQITFRVIPRETALNAPVKDLKSVIYADFDAPEPALRDKLLEFAEQGGILIVPDVWKDVPGQPEERQNYHRFQVRRFGKGRIALGTEEWSDPWVVSLDAHLLTSYRSDPFRFFNAISSNAHYTVSEDGRKAVLHMINYATRESAGDVSVQIAGKPRSARLWTFSGQPVNLRGAEARNATEFSLPPFSVYAAVELEM
jgi:hypothetical protein